MFLGRERTALSIASQIGKQYLANKDIPFKLRTARGMSLSYAEAIIAKLKKSGIVLAYRGPGGGYMLTKHPNQISVASIFMSVSQFDLMKRHKKGQPDYWWLVDSQFMNIITNLSSLTLHEAMKGNDDDKSKQ